MNFVSRFRGNDDGEKDEGVRYAPYFFNPISLSRWCRKSSASKGSG